MVIDVFDPWPLLCLPGSAVLAVTRGGGDEVTSVRESGRANPLVARHVADLAIELQAVHLAYVQEKRRERRANAEDGWVPILLVEVRDTLLDLRDRCRNIAVAKRAQCCAILLLILWGTCHGGTSVLWGLWPRARPDECERTPEEKRPVVGQIVFLRTLTG